MLVSHRRRDSYIVADWFGINGVGLQIRYGIWCVRALLLDSTEELKSCARQYYTLLSFHVVDDVSPTSQAQVMRPFALLRATASLVRRKVCLTLMRDVQTQKVCSTFAMSALHTTSTKPMEFIDSTCR